MNPDLMEILCCPVCRATLTLAATKTEGTEIVAGTLTCTGCKNVYPIDDGIPDLLPPDERD
ncbi:MAG TPA: methytransferase partner Trm112 [Thermoplasmata archaeon]|nr:methytransferase partner Trm112 [Thermoplasmata archaeon]